jgi:hypothetical protein
LGAVGADVGELGSAEGVRGDWFRLMRDLGLSDPTILFILSQGN